MLILKTSTGFNYRKFFTTMHEQFSGWRGNVQIAHVAKRTPQNERYIEVRINPVRGYELEAEAEEVALAVLPAAKLISKPGADTFVAPAWMRQAKTALPQRGR